MTKLRVYELAKQLSISSKKLISILEDLDIKVKNHMSSLEDGTAQLVIDLLTEESKGNNKTTESLGGAKTEELKEEIDKVEKKIITLPEKISVKDLGACLEVEPVKIIKKLIDVGLMVNINEEIDFNSAKKITEQFGFEALQEVKESVVSVTK